MNIIKISPYLREGFKAYREAWLRNDSKLKKYRLYTNDTGTLVLSNSNVYNINHLKDLTVDDLDADDWQIDGIKENSKYRTFEEFIECAQNLDKVFA